MRALLIGMIGFWCAGCAVSPVPTDVIQRHQVARTEAALLRPLVREGDIIFRLSSTGVAGNLLNFSREVAKLTDSDFSHAVMVIRNDESGVLLADVTERGVERRYLIDWLMDRSDNLVVRRLRPEYRYLVPRVLKEMEKVIESDNLYDDKFAPDDDTYYCTELLDHVFRETDHPLAPRTTVRQLPRYNFFVAVCCAIGGIGVDNEVVVAGNDRIGLFSSPMLETVVDMRPNARMRPFTPSPVIPMVAAAEGSTPTDPPPFTE